MRERRSDEDALFYALEWYDEHCREDRAERIRWAQVLPPKGGLVVGPVELMKLIEEAHHCYIAGLFVATLLTAMAAVEHILQNHLIDAGVSNHGDSLITCIGMAKRSTNLPRHLLDGADELRKIRNPYSHLKPADHEHNLGARYVQQDCHPRTIEEDDAKRALVVMFGLFKSTLQNVA